MAGSKKKRKDNRGRILRIGESYVAEQSIYKYRFTDFLGQRHTIYGLIIHRNCALDKRIIYIVIKITQRVMFIIRR